MKKILLIIGLSILVNCAPVQERPKLENHLMVEKKNEGCPLQFEVPLLCGEVISLQDNPQVMKRNHFKLLFWKEQADFNLNSYVDPGYSIEVIPWMRMPNGEEHGTSRRVIVTYHKSNDGNIEYLLDDVRFTMHGLWQLKIRLIQNGVRIDEAIQYIEI